MLEDTAGTASILMHATLSCLTYKKQKKGGKKGLRARLNHLMVLGSIHYN